MGGFSANTNNQPSGSDVIFASNVDFSGQANPASTILTNGQLLIGTTALNAGSTHINVGNIVSTNANLVVGYNSPNITLTSAAAGTDLHTARFIVSAGGIGDGSNFTTIGAAYAAAVLAGAPQTVFVQPGTYTENITLTGGINISAYNTDFLGGGVTVIGKFTATQVGTVCISGIQLQTNADFVVQSTGVNAAITQLLNCLINASNNTALNCTNANASINVRNSSTSIGGAGNAIFAFTAGSHVFSFNNGGGGGNLTASTISGGSIIIKNSQFQHGITTSGTAEFHLVNTQMGDNRTPQNVTMLTCGGSGEHDVDGSVFFSGTAVAITISNNLTLTNSTIWSTNASAITGAGTLTYSGINFASSSSTITTTTQVPLIQNNYALKIVTPGGYPYTTVSQDAVILVDSSAARTITPLASPTTGQRHIIKDSVGTAAANNISITPSGKNIDGVATKIINTNYGSMTIVYNGTQWNIL